MMRFYKKNLLLICLFSIVSFSQKKVCFTIENTLDFDRNEKVVSINFDELKKVNKEIDTTNLIVIYSKSKKQIPYQFEYLGQIEIQNLLLQVDVKAKSTIEIALKKGKKETFETKTYGRYVPERKDDFAWENDKIAFRAYGKALEGTKENAYGYDVWVKRTDEMVINERYKIGKYHEDQGNGMDYYHVGLTLGAGNMAPFYNDSIAYSGNYKDWKILDNGPLRTSFELTYDSWKVGNSSVSLKKTISIDAGSQLSKIINQYNFEDINSLETVIGIIKRKENDSQLLDETNGVIGYWEPTHPKYGTTGVGVIIPNKIETIFEKYEQILAKSKVNKNESFTYYTGACWDKQGDFTSSDDWFAYLYQFKKEIDQPLKITLK